MREAHPSSGSLSKAMAKALLGSGEQVAPGKPWRLPLQPSRSRMVRLSLKDHGKFNSNTVGTVRERVCAGGCTVSGVPVRIRQDSRSRTS